MTREQYLFKCLAEECAEVIQRISKAERFTFGEVQPGTNEGDNRERIAQEIDDFIAVRSMLMDEGFLRTLDTGKCRLKREKVLKYFEYSKERGVIQNEVPQ